MYFFLKVFVKIHGHFFIWARFSQNLVQQSDLTSPWVLVELFQSMHSRKIHSTEDEHGLRCSAWYRRITSFYNPFPLLDLLPLSTGKKLIVLLFDIPNKTWINKNTFLIFLKQRSIFWCWKKFYFKVSWIKKGKSSRVIKYMFLWIQWHAHKNSREDLLLSITRTFKRNSR